MPIDKRPQLFKDHEVSTVLNIANFGNTALHIYFVNIECIFKNMCNQKVCQRLQTVAKENFPRASSRIRIGMSDVV